MSSGSTKPPKAPDPQVVIDAQARANRVNQVGPYGTTTYTEGPDGRATQTSTLSPELQAVMNRVFEQAAIKPEPWQLPNGYDQLMGAVGQRVGDRYGMSAKPSQQALPKPQQQRGGP
jgi:hypothetical protein